MKILKLTVIFFCILFGKNVLAQNEILDGLKKQLLVTKSNKEVINLRNKLAAELRMSDADSAINIAQQSLLLAQKENYDFGIAVSNLCIGLANSVKGNFSSLKEYTNRALLLAEKLNNDSLKAACNLPLAVYFQNTGNYEEAIKKAFTSISFYEKINNRVGIIKARITMAQIYQNKGDLIAAEKILKELSFEKPIDKKIEINILHTLANIYGMQEKYAEALSLDDEALKICEAQNVLYLKSSIYDNMANCYMYKGDFMQAKKYFNECLKIDSSFGNKKQMADTYLNLGQLSSMQNDYFTTISYLKKAISYAIVSSYKLGEYEAYIALSKVYNKVNEKDSAYKCLSIGYGIKDSLFKQRSENQIAELETLYQTEKKQQLIVEKENLIRKKNILLLSSLAFIFLICLSAFLYYRKRNLQTKITLQTEIMHQQDIATKAIIEAEENERKRISAELHDGIGQMMSVAKMNLSSFKDEINFTSILQKNNFENVINIIDESCNEVRQVSHQMMPNALLKSGLANAVRAFISKIDDKIIKVTLHTEGLNDMLDSNVETVLYRVIQECVNNVLKHANANHLDISIIKDTDGIAAIIEDNGKGFDASNKENFEGIGLKNIASRVNYLKGTLDFDSKINKGTVVAIHIPI